MRTRSYFIPFVLVILLQPFPCLSAIEIEGMTSHVSIARIIDAVRRSLPDFERNYNHALSNARESLRAYFNVKREFYTVYDVRMTRSEAASQVKNALHDLNRERLFYIKNNGYVRIKEYELDSTYIEKSFANILHHFEVEHSVAVMDAILNGGLVDNLSRSRVRAALLLAANLDGWPQELRQSFDSERKSYLDLYTKLLNIVASVSGAKDAFEFVSDGESFDSLYVSDDTVFDSISKDHPLCEIVLTSESESYRH